MLIFIKLTVNMLDAVMLSVSFFIIMLIFIILTVIMPNVVMLSVSFFICRAECLYVECRGANFLGFSCHSDTSLSSKKVFYVLKKKMFLFTKTLQLFRAEIRVAEIQQASKF